MKSLYVIDLSAQMAVCDANFIRILKLLGSVTANKSRIIALPGGKASEPVQVVLEVIEKFKYTSTVSIKQVLPANTQDSSLYAPAEMQIRMYHDASTAEVIGYQNHRYFKPFYAMPNVKMYQCDEKEQLNLFLAEWLSLCIDQGMFHGNISTGDMLAAL